LIFGAALGRVGGGVRSATDGGAGAGDNSRTITGAACVNTCRPGVKCHSAATITACTATTKATPAKRDERA